MYRTPRLAWKSYKDYPIKERMVSNLEDNKKSISKKITNLNKNKEYITDEIDKKKKIKLSV